MTFTLCLALVVACPGAVVRRTLQHAGITQKAAAHDMGINQGLLTRELSGERHLPIDRYLTKLPESFRRWLPVVLASTYGLPEEAETMQALERQIRGA